MDALSLLVGLVAGVSLTMIVAPWRPWPEAESDDLDRKIEQHDNSLLFEGGMTFPKTGRVIDHVPGEARVLH
jgi:hypothetical protein